MALYKNRYRIESARLKGWNYSSPGYYFITICTKNRVHWFGEIIDGKMVLSECGKITNQYWFEINNHFINIELDEFVVMPNHIHGILNIKNHSFCKNTIGNIPIVETPNLGVSTGDNRFTGDNRITGNIANMGIIINQYKRICTLHIRKNLPEFAWQSRFHDRVIRDRNELNRIRTYICHNQENWENDDKYTLK